MTTQDKITELAELEREIIRIHKGDMELRSNMDSKYSVEIYYIKEDGAKSGGRRLLFIADNDIVSEIIKTKRHSLEKKITVLKKVIRERFGME